MLNKLHAGHQGITKYHQWALQSVWWPAISKDIEETGNRCKVCCTTRFQHPEPLLSSEFPNYPWQCLASDLFEWKKLKCLSVIDYYSCYIEIARLSTATSDNVTSHMKIIFARHRVPESWTSPITHSMQRTSSNTLPRSMALHILLASHDTLKVKGFAERGQWELLMEMWWYIHSSHSIPFHTFGEWM